MALYASFVPFKMPLDELINAVEKSNVNNISVYIGKNVSLTFPDRTAVYSKQQADVVLKDFFNNNSTLTYANVQRTITSNAASCIGTLYTNKAKYRLSMYLAQVNGKYYLQELRVEYSN